MSFWAGAGAAAITGIGSMLGNASSSKQTRKNRNEQRRQFDVQMQRMNDLDIGTPWHKLGNEAQQHYYDQTQRGHDMDRESANQSLRDQYAMAKAEGATLQEFLGSPAAGGGGGGSGAASTLGNMASTQNAAASQAQTQMASQKMALDHDARQRDADRQVEMASIAQQAGSTMGNLMSQGRGQDIQMRGQDMDFTARQMEMETKKLTTQMLAEAQITSSSIQAKATVDAANIAASVGMAQLKEQTRFNDARIAEISAATAALKQDTAFKKVLHDERWARLAAEIGPDNLLSMTIAAQFPEISLEQLAQGTVPDELHGLLMKFEQALIGSKSKTRGEFEGADRMFEDVPWGGILGALGIGGAALLTRNPQLGRNALKRGVTAYRSWKDRNNRKRWSSDYNSH